MPGHRGLGEHFRILVIDHNVDVADSFLLLLRCWGFDAEVAYSAQQARCVAEPFRPNLVLLEPLLPQVADGYALAESLRSLLGSVAFIAVSVLAREPERQISLAHGFSAHLPKPVDGDRLLEELASAAFALSAGWRMDGSHGSYLACDVSPAEPARPA